MKKRQWVPGMLTILFCIMMIAADPAQAKAGTASQSDMSAYKSVFDASYYYNAYSDVASAYGTSEDALFSHYVKYGAREGRNSSAEFNLLAYRQRYEDLRKAFGNNLAAYCRHYVQYGKAEGRNATLDGMDVSEIKLSAEGISDEKTESMDAQTIESTSSESANSVSGNVIGTYSTKYEENVPRASNVRLAAQRINGVVVMPNENFSFSNTILPRTSANGYVAAPIFISGKVGTGTGGGVCQVSSTLYAAMVSAGLPATERHPHSRPVDYLPQGLDATIAGNYLDLKFTNTFAQPLLIQATADNGVLTVTLIL